MTKGKVKPIKKDRSKKSVAKPLGSRISAGYDLRLFVAGATARSHQAVLQVRQLCEAELKGRYTLEVIDIYQQPALVRENQIVATPTLIRDRPKPVRRYIGNLAIVAGLAAQLAVDSPGKLPL